MTISDGLARAFDTVAARERDVLEAYTPGAVPLMPGAAAPQTQTKTLDPLSVAPPDGAYFLIEGAHGGRLLTRDGGFAMRGGGLVDRQGRAVLGFKSSNSTLSPLRAEPADVALGFTDGVSIAADGSVTYARRTIDPRSGAAFVQQSVLGRIALARFAAGTKLRNVDPSHAVAGDAVPHIGRPQDGNFVGLQPFARAGSGIDLDAGLERLQEAYLSLDAIRVAQRAQDGTQKTAMDLLK
ncbi:MAG TPA: hypothetical protein VFA29_10885 [Candidatus Baltobacteraceae bacterium]|nr:hypothetical protein [Candidatus Baltobacteraceae bacterium]